MPEREPETHDYTKRHWGHNFTVMSLSEDGYDINMLGWGNGIRQGDYLLLPASGGTVSRYKVETIEYFSDPADMWKVEAKFAPQ